MSHIFRDPWGEVDWGCHNNLGKKSLKYDSTGLSIKEAGKPGGDEDTPKITTKLGGLKKEGV